MAKEVQLKDTEGENVYPVVTDENLTLTSQGGTTFKSWLNDSSFYKKPSEGIPASDLTEEVQEALNKAHEHSNKDVLDGITAEKIAGWDGNGSYSKPADGIPASDLAEDVQDSLGKADNSMQVFFIEYKSTDISGLRAAIAAGKSVFLKVSGSEVLYPLANYSDNGSNSYSYTFSSIKNNVCTSYTMSKPALFSFPVWGTITQTLYELPSNGIPAGDLALTVQTQLNWAHEHDNKDVLDGISEEDVAAWGSKQEALSDEDKQAIADLHQDAFTDAYKNKVDEMYTDWADIDSALTDLEGTI